MFATKMQEFVKTTLEEIKLSGNYKDERVLASPQGTYVTLQDGRRVLNLCSNNYLGLCGHPEIIAAAKDGIDKWGHGLSSVRFICGTQVLHKKLEDSISEFLGTESSILYSSCFDANVGVFQTIFSEEDAILSDELNHASIIDGIRLCKAQRFRYKSNDMDDLESKLKEASSARFRLIVTDGVFSMEGTLARLKDICDLAEKYEALVMIDDAHGVGVLGSKGRGTHEYWDVMGRIDIITGTFGKALGGASGGYVSGKREIIEFLRQRSRPYLFSNTLAPGVASVALKAIEIVSRTPELIEKLHQNTQYFRKKLTEAEFSIPESIHPIVPIILGDERLEARMAQRLLEEGIYVVSFSYPVVPRNTARIRIQISAGFTKEDMDFAIDKFIKVRKELK